VSVGSVTSGGLWRIPLVRGERPQKIPSMREDGLAGAAWLDRDSIVFTSFDGGAQVWTMKADGSGRRQLTTDGWNEWPRPSRDGRTIFFVSDRGGGSGIWRMERDGSRPRLVSEAVEPSDPVLSPDERTVYFTSPGPDRTESTWAVPSDGGTPVLVVRGLTRTSVSSDGRMLAGIWQEQPSGSSALAVFAASGGAPLKTFDGNFPVKAGGVWWSRGGDAIYFTLADRTNVWRQPLAGGKATPVTTFGEGAMGRGDLSDDGRTLLAFRGNQMRDAFLITGYR
jgi:Tol biopolymer transport system component